MKKMNILASALAVAALTGCTDTIEMRRPQKFVLPDLPHCGAMGENYRLAG